MVSIAPDFPIENSSREPRGIEQAGPSTLWTLQVSLGYEGFRNYLSNSLKLREI
jgi:hypothetical protein